MLGRREARGSCSMQRVRDLRRQRPESEAQLGAGRDHVGLDAALDATDVEAQAGQAAEAQVLLGLDEVQRPPAPAHGRDAARFVAAPARRRHAGTPAEAHPHRSDAAVRQYRLAHRRLGHDGLVEAVLAGQESRDAARDRWPPRRW